MGIALNGGGLGGGISVVPSNARGAAGGGAASTIGALMASQGAAHVFDLADESDSVGAWADAVYREGGTDYTSVDDVGNGWTRLASSYPSAAEGAVELTTFASNGNDNYLRISTAGGFKRTQDRSIVFAWRPDPSAVGNTMIMAGDDGGLTQDFWGNFFYSSTNLFVLLWDGATQTTSAPVTLGTWHMVQLSYDATGGQYVIRTRPLSGSTTTATYTEPAGSASPAASQLRFLGGDTLGGPDGGGAIGPIGLYDSLVSLADFNALGDLLDEGLVA